MHISCIFVVVSEKERAGAQREPMRAGAQRRQKPHLNPCVCRRSCPVPPGAGADGCDDQEQMQREGHADVRSPGPSPWSSSLLFPRPVLLPGTCLWPALSLLSSAGAGGTLASMLASPRGGRNDSPDPECPLPASLTGACLAPPCPLSPELPVVPGLCAWLQRGLLTSPCFLPSL